MDLIEALFGKIPFFIVLLWIIGSILGQRSREKEKGRTKPSPHQTKPSSHHRPAPEPPVQKPPVWLPEEMKADPLDDRDGGSVHLREIAEESHGPSLSLGEKEEGDGQLPSVADKTPLAGQRVKIPSFASLTRSQLIQGVIWQEVLGTPRAIRPHPLVRRKWK